MNKEEIRRALEGKCYRDFAIPEGAINVEKRTVELAFASEVAVSRWWGTEILDVSSASMRMERLQNGAALLVGHDTSDQVGVIERAWIDGDRVARALVRFGRSARAEEIFQDAQDGIRKLVSVGYRVHEYVLEKSDDSGDTYRITDWEPFEISLVAVPADATVGVGRGLDTPVRASQTPGSAGSHSENQMPGKDTQDGNVAATQTRSEGEQKTLEQTPAPVDARDIVNNERDRIRQIGEMGRIYKCAEEAQRAIVDGVTLDAFRATVLERMRPKAPVTPAESSEIGMSARELNRYSFARAMLVAMDPLNASLRKAAGFELEVSEAARQTRGNRTPQQDSRREGAITIPDDVLRSVFTGGATQEGVNRVAERLGRRDLVAGTATAGGNLVATNLLSSSFIDLLRARACVVQMGAWMLAGLTGNIAIPRQTGGASCYWVGENDDVTESEPSFDQVPLSPKTVGTYVDYSRRLLEQSSVDIEAFIRADLAATIAVSGIDYAALNGSGSSNQPTGLFNATGVGAVAMGANGGVPTWDAMVDLETAIATVNADVGGMAYLTNAKVRGKLKKTQKFASTNGVEIWGKGRGPQIGDVNGYDAYVSNNVPSTLTKGTSAGVCSAMAFGNWNDLIIGMWGGLDILFDPYTRATSGGRRLVALQDLDITLRRPGSFAVVTDLTTA